MTRIDYGTAKRDEHTLIISVVLVNDKSHTLLHLIKNIPAKHPWQMDNNVWISRKVTKLVSKILASYLMSDYSKQFNYLSNYRFISDIVRCGVSILFTDIEENEEIISLLFGKVDKNTVSYYFDIDDYRVGDHFEFNF